MQPLESRDKLRGQLDAFGIDAEATIVDLAFSCDNIEIATWCLGVEDGAVLVFNLFKTAETALVAL